MDSKLVVTVMYPGGVGDSFDHDYYMATHIPLVQARWGKMGLEDARILRGVPGPDGAEPRYQLTAVLTFASMEAFAAAASAHGGEIFADIPRFTNTTPVVQCNEVVS